MAINPNSTTAGSTTMGSGSSAIAGSTSSLGSPGTSAGTSMSDSSGSRGADDDRYLTGLFPDRDSAERAYQGVVDRGYKSDDINLVMSDETRKRHFSGDSSTVGARETELGNKAAEGAGIGAGIGGAIGAIAAAVVAVGTSVALPGLGLVIAGPIAAALLGAGAGGMAGGLVGALVGMNMPEERVKEYEEGIKNGGIMMGIRTKNDDDASHLEQNWRGANGQSVYR